MSQELQITSSSLELTKTSPEDMIQFVIESSEFKKHKKYLTRENSKAFREYCKHNITKSLNQSEKEDRLIKYIYELEHSSVEKLIELGINEYDASRLKATITSKYFINF